MKKIVLVLANQDTYNRFITENRLRPYEYKRVNDPDQLRGYNFGTVTLLDLCDMRRRLNNEIYNTMCRQLDIDLIVVEGYAR